MNVFKMCKLFLNNVVNDQLMRNPQSKVTKYRDQRELMVHFKSCKFTEEERNSKGKGM